MSSGLKAPLTAAEVRQRLLARNPACEAFVGGAAHRLALASQDMAERFKNGGRLLAHGGHSYATDAQHISVEFVHPVIVGKRALPALDISAFDERYLRAMVEPNDMVFGFGPPEGSPATEVMLLIARERGAMTVALPGYDGVYHFGPASDDPFMHQEIVEVMYHTLWETVHVFLERSELGLDAGESSFLYPFLGQKQDHSEKLVDEVAESIRMKARDDSALRSRVAEEESERIVSAVTAIRARLEQGGRLLIFGNGGSATDANDFAYDCVRPPDGMEPVPAISFASEPAICTAIANDVGMETIFLRQLIAHGRKQDVAVGISTSGGSANVVAALAEARKRGKLTVALLGYDGGEIVRRGLADFAVVVRSDYIPRIQEVQASVYHVMRELLA